MPLLHPQGIKARELNKLGHHAKILPAQHVKAYVRGNKNDYNDALGIAEAVRLPELRAVAAKTVAQQSLQALHRMRRSAVADRTGLVNQVRGLLAEFGIVFGQGISVLRKALPALLADGDNGLHPAFRTALGLKYEQLRQLDKLVAELTETLEKEAAQHSEIRCLQSIPGFGAIVASTFFSVVGDGKSFPHGRDVSVALGIVPRQHSSGGKQTLLGIYP